MKLPSKKRLTSVLGLSLTEGHCWGFQVARAKNGIEVVKVCKAELALDLLHPEAELVGREIKNHLDAAGIRERQCIVAIPARWIMSQRTKVPDLSPADTASFLEIEAEKGFPVDPAQLQIARSFHRSATGSYVTQLAVRREQLSQLSAVLRAAGLKPLSFSLGLPVIPGVMTSAGASRITVAAEPESVTLLVSGGGGIAAFRTCEANIESEAGEKIVNGAAVARDLRITFEQVPVELRAEIAQLFLTGDSNLVRQLAESLGEWARAAGLTIERGDVPEKTLAAEMARQLAVRWLEAGTVEIEFLPPRPDRWTALMSRYNSKRLATAGFALGAAALVAGLLFGWKEYRRWTLRSEWNAIAARVTALDAVQARINEFRPWYDTGFRHLSILKRVTECFPENGTVTAKSFEVHRDPASSGGVSVVSISGTARDNAALLRTLDQLRKFREVQALKIEQIRGKTPAQFTFTFRWIGNTGT